MYKDKLTVWVYGKETELYTIGYVARLLKRSVETVRAWERQGVIPKPMFKHRNNVRLYHPDEVVAMKKVLKKMGPKANRVEMQKLMYEALSEVRTEIIKNAQRPDPEQEREV